jgi:hypothetical protein
VIPEHPSVPNVDAGASTGARSFFGSRWRGAVPLPKLVGQDMLIYGTALNVAAGTAGLLLFANDAPTWLAAGIYFAPSPYNLFLFAAVWRTADGAAQPQASIARGVALVWLIASLLI